MSEKNNASDSLRFSWTLARTGLIVLLVVLMIFAVIFPLTMLVKVDVGHAVILVDPLSKSIGDPMLGPAFALKAPWVSAVDIYYATDSYETT
ncbi:hypothetical protein E3I90_02540, partial [Candidatus Bathyarchaeota archaeon]